jgi:hypothetical protein
MWLVCVLAFCTLKGTAFAQVPSSLKLGTNLAEINDYSSQQPFKDIFLYSREWLTQCRSSIDSGCTSENAFDTGESGAIDLDQHGWVRSLPSPSAPAIFTSVATFWDVPAEFPAGRYVVLFDGAGTIEYGLGAQKNTAESQTGRDIITVTPANGGILLRISATSPSNYLRNIRVVSEAEEASLSSSPFTQAFLNRIAPYQVLRFMDWMRTNNSFVAAWNDRARSTDARYSTPKGAPPEIMIRLANSSQKAPWFTMPAQATDEYLANFATLVKSELSSELPVFVEYSNEVWNPTFSQGFWVEQQGQTTFAQSTESGFTKRINWHGKRTAEVCDIFKAAFGAQASRVICVLGSQAANSWTASEALQCPLWSGAPCVSHGITALGIAPYFGDYIGQEQHYPEVAAWLTHADSGLSALFNELIRGGELTGAPSSGSLEQSFQWIEENLALAQSSNLQLVAYEGGQHLAGIGAVANDDAVTALFTAANRDTRIGDLYSRYLDGWTARGGALFTHFSDITSYSRFGSWGALERIGQSSSAKYDALKSYVGFASTTPPSSSTVTLYIRRKGDGRVVSQGGGIVCGARCSVSVRKGKRVAITARPAKGNRLESWSPPCTKQRPRCVVSMSRTRRITAIFRAPRTARR